MKNMDTTYDRADNFDERLSLKQKIAIYLVGCQYLPYHLHSHREVDGTQKKNVWIVKKSLGNFMCCIKNLKENVRNTFKRCELWP